MERYGTAEANKWLDRTELFSVTQKYDQSVSDYITEIQRKQEKCNASESIVMDVAIKGLKPALRQHILHHAPKCLKNILDWGRLTECATTGVEATSEGMAEILKKLERMELR